jgi:hypothetical protein
MAFVPLQSPLDKIAFVATLVWAMSVGALLPAAVAGALYGKPLAALAGIVGGTIGYLIHRYAWSEPITRR